MLYPTSRGSLSLCSRLGVVYVSQSCVPPTSVFSTWLEGSSLSTLLEGADTSVLKKTQARLSELADLLMWPTLTYMAGRGDAVIREEVATFQVGAGMR